MISSRNVVMICTLWYVKALITFLRVSNFS